MAVGVDVSRHQGDINWRAAHASGVQFAYIKVSEGIGYVDPRVDEHLGAARAADVLTGLYHFARPDTNSGAEDGEHFAAEVNSRSAAGPGNLPPCLDLEELRPGSLATINLTDWVSAFLATARRRTGRRQFMLYASASFLRDRLRGLGWLDDDCLVWVAHYGRAAGKPGWKDHRTVMHQYTSQGRIAGYNRDIDVNSCWVDLASLSGGRPLPPPPKPKPKPRPTPGTEYVVKADDTLSGIADKLGIAGGWKALYNLNRDRIADPDHIQPGWKLRTFGAPTGDDIRDDVGDQWHTVQPGESLSTIAQNLGVAGGWEAIWNANRRMIGDPDTIFPGQRLRIPR